MPTNGLGLAGPDTYANEGDRPPLVEIQVEDEDDSLPAPRFHKGVMVQELPDGSLQVDFSGGQSRQNKGGSEAHDANLAEYLDDGILSRISSDLLDGINADIESRREWLEKRAAGIKHLALTIENPRSPSVDADTAIEGQSTVRWPGLLDAVLRFQANARGELLPAAGPVKVRNSNYRTAAQKGMDTAAGMPSVDDTDDLAEALEIDLNFYLTDTDKAYYADTNRMFFMQGVGGSGFKKVYYDPLKRRPISRAIDAEKVIVSNAEVSLTDCGRVTHQIEMRQSVYRRMELAGQYKEWAGISQPEAPDPDPVTRAKDDVGGFSTQYSMRPADYVHVLYECYCEYDIEGFEHKQDGEITHLPLPYRVTIEKTSQKIVEIRRNWREGDALFIAHMPIVKYPFVDAMNFYGVGLLQIMGNCTAAVSTAWRLALDSAGFASWPGFLYSDQVDRQDKKSFKVPLGGGVRVNTNGQDIRAAVLPLPYKDVTAGLVQMTQHLEEEARRVGMTPEIQVGEGRADVPVGTTIAMLDQAQKVLDSVHKGMHLAQSEEFSLLRDLFREYPDALLCNPHGRSWKREELVRALENCRLAPHSDPNTPSHTMRIMKAVALLQLYQLSPRDWKYQDLVRRVSQMVGLGSIEELLVAPNQQQQQMDPKLLDAQAKLQDIAFKAQDSKQKLQLESINMQLKLAIEQMRVRDSAQDRASQERIEQMRQDTERMQLAQTTMIHPESIPYAQSYLPQLPAAVGRYL